MASVAFAALNVIIGFVGAPEPDGTPGGPAWLLWVASGFLMFGFFALSVVAGLYHLRDHSPLADEQPVSSYSRDLMLWWVGAALAIGVVLGAGVFLA